MNTKILNNKKTISAIAAIVVVLTYVLFTVQADSNDDPGMMQYISGFYCGQPGILPYIMGVPYTILLSALYHISTIVPWYGIMFLIINTGAVICIFIKYMKHNYKYSRFLLFMCLYMTIFLYQLTNIQFTMVSGLAGSAAIMLANDSCESEKKITKIFDVALIAIFFFFSWNIRFQCGCVALFMICYVTIGKNILIRKKCNKKQIASLIICIIVFILSTVCNTLYKNNTEWKKFENLNSQRSYYMDTEHITWAENKCIYDSMGWDEDVYYLINHWCFMMDEASLKNFTIINKACEPEKKMLAQTLKSSIKDFTDSLPEETSILILWAFSILILVIHKVGKIKRINDYLDIGSMVRYLIYIVGFFAIAIAFIMYLFLFGRFNSRTVIMILDCCLIPGFYTIIDAFENSHFLHKNAVVVFSILGLIFVVFMGLKKETDRKLCDYDKWDNVYDYVLSNKGNIYVGDGSMTDPCDLFQSFTAETAPTNYFWWGGWLAESPFDRIHKETNNLAHLKLEDMLDENKYFIGNEFYMNHLKSYYSNRYEDIDVQIYCEVDDYIVYGFRSKKR